MMPMLIISATAALLGIILLHKNNEAGPLIFGLGICFVLFFGLQSISLANKISFVREQTKNVRYLTALDVADLNKTIMHIKTHPFMYSMLNTDGIEYISLDGAGYFKVEAAGK